MGSALEILYEYALLGAAATDRENVETAYKAVCLTVLRLIVRLEREGIDNVDLADARRMIDY